VSRGRPRARGVGTAVAAAAATGATTAALAVVVLLAGCRSDAVGDRPGAATAPRAAASTAAVGAGPSELVPAPVRPATAPSLVAVPSGLPQVAVGRDRSGAAPFVPLEVVLPSGRSAPVLAADTGADGTLAVPPDPAQVGWWTGGARAGDPYGSLVLAGHVDSRRYGVGVLAELASARPGGLVRLASGSAVRSYRITSVRRVPKASLAADGDIFARRGPARLVLLTCGGAFDARTHSYADNVVVLASPLP